MSMPATKPCQDCQTFRAVWRGIGLEIGHRQNWSNLPDLDHIEIRSDGKTLLPITKTGYKSHFLSPEQIAEFGSALDFVLAWLEHAAKAEQWKWQEQDARQLSLF